MWSHHSPIRSGKFTFRLFPDESAHTWRPVKHFYPFSDKRIEDERKKYKIWINFHADWFMMYEKDGSGNSTHKHLTRINGIHWQVAREARWKTHTARRMLCHVAFRLWFSKKNYQQKPCEKTGRVGEGGGRESVMKISEHKIKLCHNVLCHKLFVFPVFLSLHSFFMLSNLNLNI